MTDRRRLAKMPPVATDPALASEPPLRVLAWPRDANRARNPYNALLYGALARRGVEIAEFRSWAHAFRGKYDVLHVHWPEAAVARPSLIAALRHGAIHLAACAALRLRGTRIVWTVHNLRSHERPHPRVERVFLRAFAALTSRFLCLSRISRDAVVASHAAGRADEVAVTPHGHYRDAYPPSATSRESARAALGWSADAFVFLYFGRIRPYKDVPALVAAFRALDDPDARLLIAGSCDIPALERRIEASAEGDARIRLSIADVATRDVRTLFALADVAVLPYAEVHNSGSAILALGLGCPVAAPAAGSLVELAAEAGPHRMTTWEGPLSAAILRAARERFERRRGPVLDLPSQDWAAIAARTKEVYAEALGRPAPK